MIRQIIFGSPSFDEAKGALDAAALRQRTIASNLANANTPGYHAQGVLFEELLTAAQQTLPMAQTQPGHLAPKQGPSIPAPMVQARGGDPGASGVNDVSVEKEMTELAENTIHFQAVSQLLVNQYHSVSSAIRSGA